MKHCFLTIVLFLFSFTCNATGLFEADEALKVTLTGPFNTIIRHKEEEPLHPFVLQASGINHQMMVRTRGHSRKEVCYFPPLRLEFDESVPQNSPFSGQDDLKLVTHCNKSKHAQAYVLREYAVYKFFELLSDASFRVRLLDIEYIDTEYKRDTQRYGFVLETTGDLAKRIGGEKVDIHSISLGMLNDQQEALVYVFQYLIGNTDWSFVNEEEGQACCHNGKLISKDNELLYIPYDFDLSGLVNANYAYPNAGMGISRVTQRLYRGFCMDRNALSTAIDEIRAQEPAFNNIIEELPALSRSQKKKTHRFLDRFFAQASDKEKLLQSFEKRCLD